MRECIIDYHGNIFLMNDCMSHTFHEIKKKKKILDEITSLNSNKYYLVCD